jgi:hypothetical protein
VEDKEKRAANTRMAAQIFEDMKSTSKINRAELEMEAQEAGKLYDSTVS